MNKTLVAQLRKERNWTQEELAERSYVTVRTIQRLESGDDVSHDTLRAVANALSVSVNNLFESIDDEESEIEINQLSKRQSFQMKKRTEEYHIYKIMIVAFIFIIMSLLGVFIPNIDGMLQTLLGIFWIFLLFTSIAFYRYFIYIYLSNKLDKKYPLTIGYQKDFKKSDSTPDNLWGFLAKYWWIVFPIGGFLFGIAQQLK